MPIVTTRDDEQRRLTITATDPWSVEEIAVAFDRQRADRTWNYSTVYDLRATTVIPTEPDILWLVQQGQQQVARHGTRGPVAVLINGTAAAAAFEQYAEYGAERSHERLRVFTDEAAAHAWLTSSQHPSRFAP